MSKKKRDFLALEKRRKKAADLFKQGYRKAEVASELGVSRTAAGKWYDSFITGGLKGLSKAETAGRKRSLSASDQQWLKNTLLKGAISAGYSTDLWTLKRVISLIKSKTGIVYTESGAWRLLGKLGFSCQRPVTKAIQRDEEKIKHWKRYRWREIKKSRSRKTDNSVY